MGEQQFAADLLDDAGTLAARLTGALARRQWLDAYLFAAGLSQIVDDRLHADPLLLNRAATHLGGRRSRTGRLAGAAAGGLATATRADNTAAGRRLMRARGPLTELTVGLAGRVLDERSPDVPGAGDLAVLLEASQPAVPLVAAERLRIPSCFHSFDQHPDDVRWLVRAFRDRYRQRDRPLCVVGVRTSGSYLAPLHAATLRTDARARVEMLSYRPGRPFLRAERATVRAVTRAGGLVLIVDDPPGSGASLAATARALVGAGVPRSRLVLLLSLFGPGGEPPDVLRDWTAVVQPWAQWRIHRRLRAAPVAAALAGLVGPATEVRDVHPIGEPYQGGDRGHLRARFAVRLFDRRAGGQTWKEILVEGAGLGYLGRQGVAVARALPGHVPHVYGFADGLLYRDWLRPDPPSDRPLAGTVPARTVADYVAARRRALPAPSAPVSGLGGRDPVWEVAAKLLGGQYEGLSVLVRPLLLDRLVRRLLDCRQPTVLDGKTDVSHWLPDSDGQLRKVDFYQRAFGHLDLVCYDPVFDLAGAAADPPTAAFEAELRRGYEHAVGEHVDGERWLLYRLAQLRRLGAAGDLGPHAVARRSAAAVHDYLAAVYLHDLPVGATGYRAPPSGPLCAIDLDGVLECDRLGFSATSPTGMLALRALIAHGYQPVLATGRSVPEVRDRCRAFGLAGGVAEYGAAVYAGGQLADLRPLDADALLGQVRKELADRPGVQIDPDYRYAVRARFGAGPLPAALVREIIAFGGEGVRVVNGEGQTDITVAGVDKGTGLAALTVTMGAAGCAFAMGDAPPDLPLLARAALARAPRNARFGAAGAAVRRTRHAYQAGLFEACAELLGHRPGSCPACRPPTPSARTRAVLAVLDLRADGLATVPARTAALAALTVAGL